MSSKKTTKRGRDAATGKFVTLDEAAAHPSTTMIETFDVKTKSKTLDKLVGSGTIARYELTDASLLLEFLDGSVLRLSADKSLSVG